MLGISPRNPDELLIYLGVLHIHLWKKDILFIQRILDEVNSNFKSNPKSGKQIIDVEPSAIVATTKVQPSKLEYPEEGEHMFHS
jgi:hypothetical protein